MTSYSVFSPRDMFLCFTIFTFMAVHLVSLNFAIAAEILSECTYDATSICCRNDRLHKEYMGAVFGRGASAGGVPSGLLRRRLALGLGM